MSTLSEISLSLLSQSNSSCPPWTFSVTGVLLAISVAAVGLYCASPTRLTRGLVSALAAVKNAYLDGAENGFVLSADVDVAERLAVLQLKVFTIRETSLRSSLSALSALCDMFNIRRSVAVFRCLGEISNESQLRDITSASESRCQCPLAREAHHNFPPSV
ncbi:hypothetical protein C8R45DRAFT_1085055 [Mycena sanguinolenta]|nr:hypothetical protein C8R45DRAFT_1085055 [Mycena sanguinolenta]